MAQPTHTLLEFFGYQIAELQPEAPCDPIWIKEQRKSWLYPYWRPTGPSTQGLKILDGIAREMLEVEAEQLLIQLSPISERRKLYTLFQSA